MNIFGGQFGGGFAGGAQKGIAANMQFGGGFMMDPTAQAPVVQEVGVTQEGSVAFYASANSMRPRDRSGRRGWGQGPSGGGNRQKRY
jgi:hypothetical protein